MYAVLVTARRYDVASLICAVDVSTCQGNTDLLIRCIMISSQIHIFVAAFVKSDHQMSLHSFISHLLHKACGGALSTSIAPFAPPQSTCSLSMHSHQLI